MSSASEFVMVEDARTDSIDVDRLIIHQFDPASPSPGGIDTCIRGLCKYAPDAIRLAIVGVDAGKETLGRKLGVWEFYSIGQREVAFLPVARLDPSEQGSRRIPHSARLVAGLVRYRAQLPSFKEIQLHRADTAFVLSRLLQKNLIYFIHTQDDGITSKSSDSFWTKASALHRSMELSTIKRAHQNVVFNEAYSRKVSEINSHTLFSPTWFDPSIIERRRSDSDEYRIVWVGRLEKPKDPQLAIDVLQQLLTLEKDSHWTLSIVGSGSLEVELKARIRKIDSSISSRLELCGRLTPKQVGAKLASSRYFLMTSLPGYEGYPRVLVEAMATGLVPVVTDGSDTGNLIKDGKNGFCTDRNASNIANAIKRAGDISEVEPITTVANLSAPNVIARIFKAECDENE